MSDRLLISPLAPPGQFFVMVDANHPEAAQDLDEADGSMLVCHPDDEQSARRVIALLGEHFDVNEALTHLRRGTRPEPLLTEAEKARRELWRVDRG